MSSLQLSWALSHTAPRKSILPRLKGAGKHILPRSGLQVRTQPGGPLIAVLRDHEQRTKQGYSQTPDLLKP